MKYTSLLSALLFTVFLGAQDKKPTYELAKDMVKATYFHDNGEISQEGYFLNGKLHGEWVMFNTTGKKIAEGQYTEGKRTGKWLFWNDQELSEVDYTNSKIDQVTKWTTATSVAVNK